MNTKKAEHDEKSQDMLTRVFTVAELLVNLADCDEKNEPTDESYACPSIPESPQNKRLDTADV